MARFLSSSPMFARRARRPASFLSPGQRPAAERLADYGTRPPARFPTTPPGQEGPFAPLQPPPLPPVGVPTNEELNTGPFQGLPAPRQVSPPGPAPFTPTGGPPMPPARDQWTDTEAYYQSVIDAHDMKRPPGIPKGFRATRDRNGALIEGAQPEPDPAYERAVSQLQAIQTARRTLAEAERVRQRSEAPISQEFTRPFPGGFPFTGAFRRQVDPLTGEPVGNETFLGSTQNEAAIARDIAQQRANAPVLLGEDVRQDPATGKWLRVRRMRNPLTGEITETFVGEAAPPLAFRQFEFQRQEAALRRKEAIDAAVNAEVQRRSSLFTHQNIAQQEQVARQQTNPFGMSAGDFSRQQAAAAQSGSAMTRQALVPGAAQTLKVLTANPGALREEQKADLLRQFAPLFEGAPGESESTVDLNALWRVLQPTRGFGSTPGPAVFVGRR